MKALFLFAAAIVYAFSQAAYTHELPSKIRGYKVHKAEVIIRTSAKPVEKNAPNEAVILLGKPEIADIALSGITIDIGAEIRATGQSGSVDFLTFNDFRINGLPVKIEEYTHKFTFKKDESVLLPKPVQVFIGSLNIARAARRELIESEDEWRVTGTVFVFGKFKKFGFGFKRVVPVKIDLKVANPLRSLKS